MTTKDARQPDAACRKKSALRAAVSGAIFLSGIAFAALAFLMYRQTAAFGMDPWGNPFFLFALVGAVALPLLAGLDHLIARRR